MSNDDQRCAKCGHRAGYHGRTFCVLYAGSDQKRSCDCDGWALPVLPPTNRLLGQTVDDLTAVPLIAAPVEGA